MEKSALQTMVGFIFPKSDDVKEELYQVIKAESGWFYVRKTVWTNSVRSLHYKYHYGFYLF